jgi:hypothetical protein
MNVSATLPMQQGIIDLNTIRATPDLIDALEERVTTQKNYKYQLRDSKQIAFHMIHDNQTVVERTLDDLRLQMPKFICLNDDMNKTHEAPIDTVNTLKEFYNSYFPNPCPLELPAGQTNQWTYIDEYRKRGLVPNLASTKQRFQLTANRLQESMQQYSQTSSTTSIVAIGILLTLLACAFSFCRNRLKKYSTHQKQRHHRSN